MTDTSLCALKLAVFFGGNPIHAHSKVVIAVDISGGMGGNAAGPFYDEVLRALRSQGLLRVTTLVFDYEIRRELSQDLAGGVLREGSQWDGFGSGGGTDIEPVFKRVAALQADLILVISDLFFPFSSSLAKCSIPTVWIDARPEDAYKHDLPFGVVV